MSVHYKFKSALEFDTVTFDGLHISVRDLKNSIMQQKRIGKNTDFDLQVTNAQTKEVYNDEEALIPKNTSLLIARIPSAQTKPKTWEGYGGNSSPIAKADDGGPLGKSLDLASADASESDKIQAMMSQSSVDYDPSMYIKVRGSNQMGAVPANYRCFKCHQGGHWIKDCQLSQGLEPIEIKKSTGIPRSFMVLVDGPQVPGAMMTPNGSFAVPVLDHQAYTEKPQPAPPEEKRPEIPDDLLCSLCSDLLTDAVMIPCCGDSYCDECIRSCLLESEDHECPACHERDISPGTLIPNRYLRNSVANFKSTTGYVKRLVHKPLATEQSQIVIDEPEPEAESPVNQKTESEKTIIREADSTEPPKTLDKKSEPEVKPPPAKSAVVTPTTRSQDVETKVVPPKISTQALPEGPPGVSPKRESSSPSHAQPITNVANAPRNTRIHKTNERSPRRPHHVRSRSPYQDSINRERAEDRPGTPTVDEPGGGAVTTMNHTNVYRASQPIYSSGPPPGMMGMPPPSIQGPPPTIPSYGQVGGQAYPPQSQGPQPNFRLPPPGSAPPYMTPGYNAPPRPVFDCTRPPMGGPPNFGPPMYPSGPPTRGRDYPRDIPPRRGRTPPRVIDDPLEAWNRMLREKDERERRAKQRKGRSYSRSSSRSFSRSPRRMRSRSPRRRSRTRSRSFSMSRSRSRSFSPNPRTSPPRQYSPKRSPHRGAHNRYRSPIRSPPARYRYKDQSHFDRGGRDRDMDRERDKEYRERDNRGYSRERDRDRDFRGDRDRDYQFYDGFDRDRGRGGARHQWNPPRKDYTGQPEPYYHQPDMPVQQPPFMPSNRYPPRDQYQPHHPLVPPVHQHPPLHNPSVQHMPPARRYDDVAPPGVEQPPIPGVENPPRFEDRYYDRGEPNNRFGSPTRQKDKEPERRKDDPVAEKERKNDRHSRSPDKNRYSSPSKPKEKERDSQASPEKHKRRRHDESSDKKESEKDKHDRKRDGSDDERSKKSKDKKKKKDKREKKEEERKKRREKREKREHEKLSKKVHEERDKKPLKEETPKQQPELQKVQIHEESVREKSLERHDQNLKNGDLNGATEEIPQETHKESPKRETKPKPIEEPELTPEKPQPVPSDDLYGDLLTEGIDSNVIETYGKIKEVDEVTKRPERVDTSSDEVSEKRVLDEDEESEKDILELHTNEAELKADLDSKSEVLAPVPERSKWEVEEDTSLLSSSSSNKLDSKSDKSGKVTNEVLKRAENAIFAKAINAIRPIEIKKISVDRAKLYSGEWDNRDDARDDRNAQITIDGDEDDETIVLDSDTPQVAKPRLSVKERLGCKVDDLDRIVKVDKHDRNRSRSLSPLSRRVGDLGRNLGQGEHHTELDDRRKVSSRSRYAEKTHDRHHRQYKPDERESRRNTNVRREYNKDGRRERDHRKEEVKRDKVHVREDDRGSHDKKKRSRTRSSSQGKRKKKDKKDRKEKVRKHHKKDEVSDSAKVSKSESDDKSHKLKSATDKRKATLDEASFVPDYDLESESEKEVPKPEDLHKKRAGESPAPEIPKKRIKLEESKDESSSSESSDSSSEDEKRKKKHRKHKKKKSRKESSSSSESESESDSSEDEKARKKRRHKKKQKKRKKSKHK